MSEEGVWGWACRLNTTHWQGQGANVIHHDGPVQGGGGGSAKRGGGVGGRGGGGARHVRNGCDQGYGVVTGLQANDNPQAGTDGQRALP
jgi:hypothetical protein